MYSPNVNKTQCLLSVLALQCWQCPKLGWKQYPLGLFLFFFREDLEICGVLNMKKANNELVRSSTTVRFIICKSGLLQIKTNLPPPTALKRNAVTKIALVWWAVWLEGPPFSPECNETPLGVDAGHKGKHLQWGNPRESIFLQPPPISTKLRSEIVLTHPLVPCDEMCRDKRRTNWCGETLRPGTVSSTTGNSETSSQENKIMEMFYSDLSLTVKKKKLSLCRNSL